MLKQLPNALTLSRCIFGFIVIYAIWKAMGNNPLAFDTAAEQSRAATLNQLWHQFALLAFVAGALTDLGDGILARALKAESRFGVWLDPIADKVLVGGTLVGICMIYPDWWIIVPAALIIGRDVFMTWFRTTARGKAAVNPSQLAKWKTTVEMIAIAGLLLPPAIAKPRLPGAGRVEPSIMVDLVQFGLVGLLWVAAALSVWTGLQYLRGTRPA